MHRLKHLLLLSAFSLLTLAACDRTPGPDTVALGMMQQLAAGDFEGAKTHTAGQARMQLELLTVLAKGKSAVPKGTEYEVTEKKIEGKQATVRLHLKGGSPAQSMQVRLQKEDKGWIIQEMK